jgi:hypothetical protein
MEKEEQEEAQEAKQEEAQIRQQVEILRSQPAMNLTT